MIESCFFPLTRLLHEQVNDVGNALIEIRWHFERLRWVTAQTAFGHAEVLLVVKLTSCNLLDLIFVKPLDALAILPETPLNRIVWSFINADSVLFASAPVTEVGTAIGPDVDAISVLLIVFVLSTVLPAVEPGVDANTVHVVLDPFTLELAAIKPRVGSETIDLIISPFTVVP